MQKVTLHFPSLLELMTFKRAIDMRQCEIIKPHLLLICALPEKEIELAKKSYKAKVVQLKDA